MFRGTTNVKKIKARAKKEQMLAKKKVKAKKSKFSKKAMRKH